MLIPLDIFFWTFLVQQLKSVSLHSLGAIVPGPGSSWPFPSWLVPAAGLLFPSFSSSFLHVTFSQGLFSFPLPFPFTLTFPPSFLPSLIPPLPWFLAPFCFLFVFLKAVLQLPHIWREEAVANPVSVCF